MIFALETPFLHFITPFFMVTLQYEDTIAKKLLFAAIF